MKIDKNDDVEPLTATDRYDLKAYSNNQYFPQPERQMTEEEAIIAEREKLGLTGLMK